MAIDWRPVYSSVVSEIGHDPVTSELHVIWARSGKHSVYGGVPAEEAERTMSAPSVGQALREGIQQRYRHRYLSENANGDS